MANRLAILLSLVVLISSSFNGALAKDEMFKRATKSLKNIREDHKLPGLTALSLQTNGNFTTGASGLRRLGNPTALTTNDKFHLGSNTKAMTATLLAKIIEEGNGTLTWNTTLEEALPNISNISDSLLRVTIAQVASHRSGITGEISETNLPLWRALFDPNYDPVRGRREVSQVYLSSAPSVPPNTTYTYSNFNYIILGHIIDNLGIPWEDRIRTDLWEPLNMTECGLGPSPGSTPDAVDNPWGHSSNSSELVPISPFSVSPPSDNPRTLGPAGTAYCSMASYSKFLALHLNGNDTFLSSSTFRFLHTPLVQDSSSSSTVNVMTPGGWIYVTGSASIAKYGRGALYHAGSNTLNLAITVVSREKGLAASSFSNVYNDNSVKGCTEAVDGIFAGSLSLGVTDNDKTTSSGRRTYEKVRRWMLSVVFIAILAFLL